MPHEIHYFLLTQFRYDCIVQYLQSEASLTGTHSHSSNIKHTLNSLNQSSGRDMSELVGYSGLVTKGVKKRIRKKMDLLLQISPIRKIYNPVINKVHAFQLAFITLTIQHQPDLPDHKTIMRNCFKPMLALLRNKMGVKDYVWKAELQVNGTIHYHLCTNRFIDYMQLRSNWNTLLKKAGLLDKYHSEHGHYDANSTDIRATHTATAASIYMSKYMAKNDNEERKIGGKVWDCSMNLKHSTQYTDELSSFADQQLAEGIAEGKIKEIKSDYVTIFKFHPSLIKSLLTESQSNRYNTHIADIKNFKMKTKQSEDPKSGKSKSASNPRLANTIKQATQTTLNIPPAWTKQLKS